MPDLDFESMIFPLSRNWLCAVESQMARRSSNIWSRGFCRFIIFIYLFRITKDMKRFDKYKVYLSWGFAMKMQKAELFGVI